MNTAKEFDETKHQRHPKGSKMGGKFARKPFDIDDDGVEFWMDRDYYYEMAQGNIAAGDITFEVDDFQPIESGSSERARLINEGYEKIIEEKLSDDQRLALERYTGSMYTEINRYGRYPDDVNLLPSQGERAKEAFWHISDAMDESPGLPENLLMYRGMATSRFTADDVFIGMTMVDNGFTSVSLDMDKAMNFSTDYNEASFLFEIEVPRGQKGLFLEPITKNGGEMEFLFPSGTTFEVLEIKRSIRDETSWVRLGVVDGP